MIKVGDKFEFHGTWYSVVEVKGNTVTTIEDPDLNRYPNLNNYTYWGLKQVENLMEKE